MSKLRIDALHVGSMPDFSRSTVTYGRDYFEKAEIAIYMFVITGGEHPVVVDTGTAAPQEVVAQHGFTFIRDDRQAPATALMERGVDPADVRTVVNTHLHWDHSSNNDLFPNATVYVQHEELRYAIDPLAPSCSAYERRPGQMPLWLKSLGRMRAVDGDQEILPGITLVHLPGHTPGSQGVWVDTGGRGHLIAGDCLPYYANWEGDARLDHIMSAGFTDMAAYQASFAKIERLGCAVIPSHDPLVRDRTPFVAASDDDQEELGQPWTS